MKHLALTMILGLGVLAATAKAEAWLTDFAQAQTEASAQRRLILANFSGSDWCTWCIRLDKEVLAQPAFLKYAQENLVLFCADFPHQSEQPAALKKQNEALAATYKIRGFPTVLLLDATGKELERLGYRPGGAAPYIEHLQTLLQKRAPTPPQPEPPEKPAPKSGGPAE